MPARLKAVLFDLDGTLVDTAPDLLGALDDVRADLGLAPLATPLPAAIAARGGRGILTLGLPEINDAAETCLPRYLQVYERRIAQASKPYPGIEALLDDLHERGTACAIVTNKPEGLARLLIAKLGWTGRFAALVGGDTLAQRKPFPQPVLRACELVRVDPARAAMVGDDARDIEAGKAAGCAWTIACAYGYVEAPERLDSWGGDAIARAPEELVGLLCR